MNQNPYDPPRVYDASPYASDAPGASRMTVLLGAIGGWLAAAYWAATTLFLTLAVASHSLSGMQLILPLFLVGLYAHRGYRVYQGDAAAAQRLVWLHGVGGLMAVVQMLPGGMILLVMYGIKVVVHVFGAVTAFRAMRALSPRF